MNSSNATWQVTLAIATLAATAAWAHPNHAEAGATTTLFHLLTQPDHLLAIVSAIGVGAWAIARSRARRRAARKQRRD